MTSPIKDDSIDPETVDLFAVMNSSLLELQIEMERLESKEYDDDYYYEKPEDTIKSDDQHQPEEDGFSTIQKMTSKLHQGPTPILCEKDTRNAENERNEWKGCFDSRLSTNTKNMKDGEHARASGSVSIYWDKIEPPKVGDPDYVPVSVPSNLVHWDKLHPAKKGDSDFVQVADYTASETNTEAVASPKQRRPKREKAPKSHRVIRS